MRPPVLLHNFPVNILASQRNISNFLSHDFFGLKHTIIPEDGDDPSSKDEVLGKDGIGPCLRDQFLLSYISPLTAKAQSLLSDSHLQEELQQFNVNFPLTLSNAISSSATPVPSSPISTSLHIIVESVTYLKLSDDNLVLAVGTSRGRVCLFSLREDGFKERVSKDVAVGGEDNIGEDGSFATGITSISPNYTGQQSHCSKCGTKFGLTTRRYRCRVCSRLFCNTCSIHKIFVPAAGVVKSMERVCDHCYQVYFFIFFLFFIFV
jgi:hypothetical protein